MNVRTLAVFSFAIAASTAAAQDSAATQPKIPIYKLSPPEAATTEPLGLPAGLKQFADGRLIVNDVLKRRLVVFDPSLTTYSVTADSNGTGATLYPRTFSLTSLYYYPGDSAVFPDMSTRIFIMIDPNGKFGRAVAHPRPNDFMVLSQPYSGSPSFDPQGRFIYRAQTPFRPRPPVVAGAPPVPVRTSDTAAIVRADFETRRIDTIAHVTLPVFASSPPTWDEKGHATAKTTINPIPVSPDDWAVLSDGSLAIVRAHDYHVDWVYADGTSASTPKMPFDWRRLTDADKQAKIDSIKHVIDSLSTTRRPYGMMTAMRADNPKVDTIIPTIEFVPFAEMLDYVPPTRPGAVKADRDNHLWILPTTTLSAVGGGLLYDVVNKKGEVFERVQLPPGRSILGFGPGGAVYLMSGDRTAGYTIERTHILAAAAPRNAQ